MHSIDSSGLGVLLLLRAKATEFNVRLILCGVTRPVKSIFDLANFGKVFEICETTGVHKD